MLHGADATAVDLAGAQVDQLKRLGRDAALLHRLAERLKGGHRVRHENAGLPIRAGTVTASIGSSLVEL